MGDRLTGESRFELPEKNIDDQCHGDKGQDTGKQMHLLEQQDITNGAHRTEAASLCKKSDEKTGADGNDERCTRGPRSLEAVEKDTRLCLPFDRRKEQP